MSKGYNKNTTLICELCPENKEFYVEKHTYHVLDNNYKEIRTERGNEDAPAIIRCRECCTIVAEK